MYILQVPEAGHPRPRCEQGFLLSVHTHGQPSPRCALMWVFTRAYLCPDLLKTTPAYTVHLEVVDPRTSTRESGGHDTALAVTCSQGHAVQFPSGEP